MDAAVIHSNEGQKEVLEGRYASIHNVNSQEKMNKHLKEANK